jgi:DnaJ-class molecular chaperone
MDFLETLFTTDEAVIAANVAESARIAAVEAAAKIENAARVAAIAAEKVANRCPRCMGEGRLPQFAHRKGGECFTCGGSGVFTRFAV